MRYGDEDSKEETEELEEYDDSEEEPEVLEIEIEGLKDTLETMESNLRYLYYKRNDMWARLGKLQYKREKLLGNLQEITKQLVVSWPTLCG